jgi:hypothetical protein
MKPAYSKPVFSKRETLASIAAGQPVASPPVSKGI